MGTKETCLKTIDFPALRIVSPRIQYPGDIAFRVQDRFVEYKSEQKDGMMVQVQVRYLSDEWKASFANLEVPTTTACDLEMHELILDLYGKQITDGIGGSIETNPAIMWWMIENDHLLKGKTYYFYMVDENHILREVCVTWGGYWGFFPSYLKYPGRNAGGGYVVCRKRHKPKERPAN
ncbi:MAG: hypothetical protein AAB428_03595 [Patescibacteria group bacterium]